MELNRIKILLDKYYQGETTLEEEKELREFLSADIVPEEYKAEQIAFQFLKQAGDETFGKKLDVTESVTPMVVREKKFTLRKIVWTAVAACLVAGIGVTYLYQQEGHSIPDQTVSERNHETYDNPEEAYEEARRALLLVSDKLNIGKDNMQKISKFHEAQSTLTARNE